MEWWQILLLMVSGILALMLLRVPVAFAFLAVNIGAYILLLGGGRGLEQLMRNIDNALTSFALTPIPFFILMGEIAFHSGTAPKMIDALDKWFGRIPARLSLLSVGGGTALATLTGSSISSIAVLGSTLLPDMERRGYKKPLSMGPILGAGGLAVLIPPSALGVLLASLAQISVGQFLIAIVVPGLLTAALLVLYVIARSVISPELAPKYDPGSVSLAEKLRLTARYILPLSIIVFLVIGLIILGVATPTEAAAMGVVGSLLLAALDGELNKRTITKSLSETMKITTMILFIVAGSAAFSQILAFTGAANQLVRFVSGIDASSLMILIAMQLIVLVMGTFMEPISIMLISLPIFMPIAQVLEFDLLWFATLLLINIEVGLISPPFGLGLFAMKAVAPEDTTMAQVYSAAIPIVLLYIAVMGLLIVIPGLVTWLPSLMAA
ncbi:MAG TPA: TRAP transporter large permease subunit [Rubrobacteraceae bacterium]|nr:TRAP transporter large permease subunit [Rubrobacteraceae bacterium]